MFYSHIDDIGHDISVLSMDKILYDNGFPTTENEIDAASEYETFFDAFLSLDGQYDDEEGEMEDCTVIIFRDGCLKKYIGLALKFGGINGIPKEKNFWISRLEAYINYEMRSVGDYSYDWEYCVLSTKKTFFRVYIGPDFQQTVNLIQSVASIMNFAEISCKELEKLTAKKKAEIIPMRKCEERKKAA